MATSLAADLPSLPSRSDEQTDPFLSSSTGSDRHRFSHFDDQLFALGPTTSPDQAKLYLRDLLDSDKKVRSATHNITAWRIKGGNGVAFQDCDDDGETAAGGRVLHLMQLMDLWDVMVVVTRWYGGHQLGPKRFSIINTVARDAFVKGDFVKEDISNKKGKR